MLFFFKQKTAYEMRISDWSSDVCSSDLMALGGGKLPDGVWDGFVDPKVADARICVQNGDAKLLNVDGPHQFKGAAIVAADCAPTTRLPEIALPAEMTRAR